MGGTAYAACKTCGWNKGGKAHTTGAHSILQKKFYFVSYKLKCKMKNIVDDEESESKEVVKKRKQEGTNTLSSLTEECKRLGRDEIDNKRLSFVGQLDQILTSLVKD